MKKRLKIWKENDERIKKHNERYAAGLETYEQAHNENSDMVRIKLILYVYFKQLKIKYKCLINRLTKSFLINL